MPSAQKTIDFPMRKTRSCRSSKQKGLEPSQSNASSNRRSNLATNCVENIEPKKQENVLGGICSLSDDAMVEHVSQHQVLTKHEKAKKSGRGLCNSKENSPLKRTNLNDDVPQLVSPSKRQKGPIMTASICTLSSAPTTTTEVVASSISTPKKSQPMSDNQEGCLVSTSTSMAIMMPSKIVQQQSTRVPLSPRHDNNNVIQKSTTALQGVVPRDIFGIRTPPRKLFIDTGAHCCTPQSESKRITSILQSPPKSDRVLRSAQKDSTAAVVSSTPEKVVRRNLCDSFCEKKTMATLSNMIPVMKLARDDGICYQKARQALHTAPPELVIGREKEAATVTSYLDDHVTGCRSGSLYISGAPGTGKTVVLKKAIERLQMHPNCQVLYVNCMTTQNAQAVYNCILTAIRGSHTQMSAKQAHAAIEKYLRDAKNCIVLVLDEIDSLDTRNQEVLYTIFDWPSVNDFAPFVLVGVANSLDLTDRILPRLQARANCRPQLLNFPPYTKDQIVAVIDDRFASIAGGVDCVFDRAAVQFCARKVSSMSGDIRMAIDICRRALEAVETESMKQLVLTCQSPSKRRSAVIQKKVSVPSIVKVINEVYGVKVTNRVTTSSNSSSSSSSNGAFPLQQTLCVCALLLMLRGVGKIKEVTLGKFHESYSRLCKRSGVAQIDQPEFLSLCTLIESRGIMSLKKAKDTRSIKVSLRMDEKELTAAMEDKTLVSSILDKGLS